MEYALDIKRTIGHVHSDPLFEALNPEGKEFLDVRWLPPALNPFGRYNIRIGAVVLKRFPHIKTVATVQMMLEDFGNGLYEGKHTIVVPSSGNTAQAVARVYPAFGFKKLKVVMSTDVPDSKVGILKAYGIVDIYLVSDVTGTARKEAQEDGYYLLDQYSHMGNLRAHMMYTGPEIVRVLGDNIAIIAIALGSGGTAAGVGRFLEHARPEAMVLGVRPILGEQVPGTRDEAMMKKVVTLPWRPVVPVIAEVTRKNAFISMKKLGYAVDPQPGPSGGLAFEGLIQHLRRLTEQELGNLRGKTVGFLCPDDGRFYPERTTGELDPAQGLPQGFPTI